MSASVELFSTSILSNHKVRHRHERFTSVLTVKKIPFVYHDLASDEDAKSRWRRKARDPQIPGLLVNNEWRGTFEEFEESVEFGELDLFLRVDQGRAPVAVAVAPATPATAVQEESSRSDETPSNSTNEKPKHAAPVGLLQPRAVSAGGPTAAPSHPLPYAAPGTGKRDEPDAQGILSSLGADSLDLDDADVDAMLAELSAMTLKKHNKTDTPPPTLSTTQKKGLYPELGTGAPAVPRTYIPSANAGTVPLKLARMGSEAQMQRSSSSASSSSSNSSSGTSNSPRLARYNASQQSSKALTAEATAFAASRAVSSAALAKAVASGTTLDEALRTSQRQTTLVGREDPEWLLASLGLADLNLSAEEAEAFLTDGTIPAGMASGGAKLKRVGSVADRARDEAGAREVARRAKELGYGAVRRVSASGSVDGKHEQDTDTPSVGAPTQEDMSDQAEAEEADKPNEEEPTTPKLIKSALPSSELEVVDSPAKESDEASRSPATAESEPAASEAEPELPRTADKAEAEAVPFSTMTKPLAEQDEPDSTPKAKELALPLVDDVPPPAAAVIAELQAAPAIKSPPSSPPIKRSTTPTPTSPLPTPLVGVQSASAGEVSVRDADTDGAIALMLSDGPGGDLFAGLDSNNFDDIASSSSQSDGRPSPLQLTSPKGLSGVEVVSSPTSPGGDGALRSLSPPTSPDGGDDTSPASTPLPLSASSSSSEGASLSKAMRSSSRIARPIVTPAPGARKGIDVRRAASSSSSGGLVTPSNSAGSLGRTASTSPSFGASGGPPRSASASFAEGTTQALGTTPKKNRFSLAKFGKDKKEKQQQQQQQQQLGPISPTASTFDASPTSSSGRSGMSREERDQKTLSQILREADAAMAEIEEDDDDAMSIMSRDDGLAWED